MIEAAEVAASQPLDFANIATNGGILIGFVVAAILGIKKGLETFKKNAEGSLAGNRANVAAAMVLEHQTVREWSETNRDVVEALRDLRTCLNDLRSALYQTRDGISANDRELAELRHQIELLRSRIS